MPRTSAARHYILELYGCSPALLNDIHFVCDTVVQACKEAGLTLLKLVSHQFDPQGVTAIALLGDSHLSIHTWPEQGYAAIDIFTCGRHATPQQSCSYLVKRFGACKHGLQVVSRGAEALNRLPVTTSRSTGESRPGQMPN